MVDHFSLSHCFPFDCLCFLSFRLHPVLLTIRLFSLFIPHVVIQLCVFVFACVYVRVVECHIKMIAARAAVHLSVVMNPKRCCPIFQWSVVHKVYF